MSTPCLAVVVIGRNEGERLVNCLRSITAMTPIGSAIDLIYVDSGSRDNSCARARACGARVIELASKRPSAAAGRNAGWRATEAPFVLFLDGDTLLAPDFVAHSLPLFDDPALAAVSGHRRESNPQQSWYVRALDLDWIAPAGLADYCGGDALIRRAALDAVGGYDETLIAGEEPEMCWRMRQVGWAIRRTDAPMTLHDLAITRLSQYWQRAVRTGHAYAEISQRLAASNDPLWSDVARANLKRGGLFLAIALTLALSIAVPPAPTCGLAGGVTAAIAALTLRSAWRHRWKAADWPTRLIYGLHSQLQHLPIFVGQIGYRLRRTGAGGRLIEYK